MRTPATRYCPIIKGGGEFSGVTGESWRITEVLVLPEDLPGRRVAVAPGFEIALLLKTSRRSSMSTFIVVERAVVVLQEVTEDARFRGFVPESLVKSFAKLSEAFCLAAVKREVLSLTGHPGTERSSDSRP